MDQADPPKMKVFARKRMLRDILEWNKFADECPMITAAPMQENIFEWHVNMNATSGILKDIILHLILTFPGDYPKQPPSIEICSYFPHNNVFQAYKFIYDRKWKYVYANKMWICLDMIKHKTEYQKDAQVVSDPYHGWSAGYSVTSVLLQLSSFLYENKTEQERYYNWRSDTTSDNTIHRFRGKKRMRHEAKQFSCIKCGHSGLVPYPALNKNRGLKRNSRRNMHKKDLIKQLKEEALELISSDNAQNTTYDGSDINQSDNTLQDPSVDANHAVAVIPRDDAQNTTYDGSGSNQLQIDNTLQDPSGDANKLGLNKKICRYKKSTKNMWKYLYHDVETLIISHLTLKDLMKLQTISLHHMKLVQDTKILQIHSFGCWFHRVDLSFHGKLNQIRGKFHGWNDDEMLKFQTKVNESNRETYSLTLGYGIIPQFYDGSSSFYDNLTKDDLLAMKQANKVLKSLNIIKSQKEGVINDKKSNDDDDDDMKDAQDPLSFPLLREVKTTFDLLSYDAFINFNIHTTPWNDQSFHHFLPIYINNKHGKRVLKPKGCFEEEILQIFRRNNKYIKKFHPLMAIHVISNIMNSLVVHLMLKIDKDNAAKMKKNGTYSYGVVTDQYNEGNRGSSHRLYKNMEIQQKRIASEALNLHYSINVLTSYFHYHHLLLSVYKQYYDIVHPVIYNKCRKFISNPQYRHKKYIPNLGEFMIYLTLTDIKWNEICPHLLDELFIRHVKWVLMEYPELYKISNELSCIRLRKTFEVSTTSVRLYMFQYFFLKKCCEIGNVLPMDKFEEYNTNFGCPPSHYPYLLQSWCRKIYSINDWYEFFNMIDIPSPSSLSLSRWLENAIIESENRGYHKNIDIDLVDHFTKHVDNDKSKQFLPKQLNNKYCICSDNVRLLPVDHTLDDINPQQTTRTTLYADIVIVKYVGSTNNYNPNTDQYDTDYWLREYPEKHILIEKVNKLVSELSININKSLYAPDIKYKLIISNLTNKHVDSTKWVYDLNECFFEKDITKDNFNYDGDYNNFIRYYKQNEFDWFWPWSENARRIHGSYGSRYTKRRTFHDYFKWKYYQPGWTGKPHEWRPNAQKYIIDLDVLELDNNSKPVVLPYTLLNQTSGDGHQYYHLNQKISIDDSIYYITIPQILTFSNLSWDKFRLTPYIINLNGFIEELNSIYSSLKDRKSLPIIAEIFEKFKKRNPNLAANAVSNSTNIYKFFTDDLKRGHKYDTISRHIRGSLLWYQPHYSLHYDITPTNIECKDWGTKEWKKYYRSSKVHKDNRLNSKYSGSYYCGKFIQNHKNYISHYNKEIFNEILPIYPKYVPISNIPEKWIATDQDMYNYSVSGYKSIYDPVHSDDDIDIDIDDNKDNNNQQKHLAISIYEGIAVDDVLITTIMSLGAYNLSINEILPFHLKHSEIKPIQHCKNELNLIKTALNLNKNVQNEELDCKLMNKYLNKKKHFKIDKYGMTEIFQIAENRKNIVKWINKRSFKRSLNFIKLRDKSLNFDNNGCIYRNKIYSEFYSNTRNAKDLNKILPILNIQLFDPFEISSSFIFQNKKMILSNDWTLRSTLDPYLIQIFDQNTHRWYNAKIIEFKSLSIIINYIDWDSKLFRDKISLSSYNVAKNGTYNINNNRIGFIDDNRIPATYSNKDLGDEYEAKLTKQERFDKKFKLLNDEYYHKYFFEAAANNDIKIVKQLLFIGRENEIENNIKLAKKNNINNTSGSGSTKNIKKNSNKIYGKKGKIIRKKKIKIWTKWDIINDDKSGSDDDDNKNDEYAKLLEKDCISSTEWLKWMNKKIDVNMTDVNGRTPLFVCAYNGYIRICKLLINIGNINVDTIDLNGKTAIDAANEGLLNATSVKRKENIKKIINLLKSKMKPIKEGNSDQKDINSSKSSWRKPQKYELNNNNKPNTINPGSSSISPANTNTNTNTNRRRVTNNEVIWTSSMIYIGNLPYNMNENDISSFVSSYYISPIKIIKKRYFTLIRVRGDIKQLNKKIKKINGMFFRGAMITVNLFDNNQPRKQFKKQPNSNNNNNAPGSSSTAVSSQNNDNNAYVVEPNTLLFVNNFDVTPGIYDVLNDIFSSFGYLRRSVLIGIDKFGDPFAKIYFYNINDAINCYNNANSMNPIKIGLRTLSVEYSKFQQRNNYSNNNYSNNNYSNNNNNTGRPIRGTRSTSGGRPYIPRNRSNHYNGNNNNQTTSGLVRPKALKKKSYTNNNNNKNNNNNNNNNKYRKRRRKSKNK